MKRNNNPIRSILGVFAIFFTVVFLVYASGKQLHEPGQGLSDSLAHEFIVQYFVRIRDGLNVDAKTSVPAVRASVGGESKISLGIRNLANSDISFQLQLKIQPENGDNIRLAFDPEKIYSLHGKEFIAIEISYSLLKPELKSKDGTLDFEVFVKKP